MYNLIITAQEGAWEGRPCELDITRVIRTFTDDDLKEKYKLLDAAAVSELQSFPALFAYEDQLQAEAHVGFITAVRRRGDDVKIEYRFWEDVPPIPASKLKELSWDLDIDKKLEINHTHWAVKRIDLLDVLVEAGLVTPEQISRIPARLMNAAIPGASRQMLVTPLVFDIIEVPRETDLVAVMMPFQAEFNPVYTAIQAACRHTGLRCQRADDVWQESVIIQGIFNLLVCSSIVVVDFSTRNPNVMYETGIAHTLGRPVVPISQSADDVPFDLRHHRFLKYHPNGEGLAALEAKLTVRLKDLAAQVQIRGSRA